MTVADFQKQLATGHPPSNAQLVGVLQHTDQLLERRKVDITDREGQKIITDAQRVVADAQLLVTERNKHEELQEIFFHGAKAVRDIAPGLKDVATDAKGRTDISADSAKRKLNSARNLVMLILRSSEFRDSIMELVHLFQQLMRMGTFQKLADKARTSKGLKGEIKEEDAKGKAPETVHVHTNVVVTPVSAPIPGMAPPVVTTTTTVPPAGAPTVTTSTMVPPAPMGFTSLAQQTVVVPPPQPTATAELRLRLRNVLKTLQANPQMQEGVRSLFRLLRQARRLFSDHKTTVKDARKQLDNDHLKEALYNAKMLFEEFTGGKSPQPLFTALSKLWDLLRNDPALRQYFKDWKRYILDGFDNPALFDDDLRLKNLVKRGRAFMKEIRTHEYTTTIAEEARELIQRVKNDPVASRLALDIQHLMHDLFMDPSGSHPTVKTDALRTLKDIIVGMFMDELKYIPVPAVSGRNEEMEFAIDGIRMTSSTSSPRTSTSSRRITPTSIRRTLALRCPIPPSLAAGCVWWSRSARLPSTTSSTTSESTRVPRSTTAASLASL
jgi:hypothetical protein